MEQLIPIIEFIKKNSFWLICGAVAVASLVTWYLAAGALKTNRDKYVQQINSSKQTAQTIQRTSASGVDDDTVRAHPNQSTTDGMQKQIEGVESSLIQTWRARVDEQADILKWPEDVIPEEAKEFIAVYEQFDPPEAFPGLANENMGQWLGVYKRNIPKRMLALCDIIGTRCDYDEFGEKLEPEVDDLKEFSGRDEMAEGMMTEMVDVPEELPVVVWSEENQLLWNLKMTEFKDRDGQSGVDGIPTPIQVIFLQQDLWLLEAMFKVIKEINGGADANDLATIKQISHIAFGREAMSQLGVLTIPDPKLAYASAVEGDGFSDDINFDDNSFGNSAEEVVEFDLYPGEGKEQLGPFHGRYVDKNFKPLTATQVQEILTGKTFPEENLELLVAKRVPVRIALKMDERKIDDFIAACANSPFAFEIWQVRVNRPLDPIVLAGDFANMAKASGAGASDDFMDDEGMGIGGGNGFRPTIPGMGGEFGEGEKAPLLAPHRRSTYDINVEFYGIVKIYNPVNEGLIKSSDGTAQP